MALSDDLQDYMGKNGQAAAAVGEQHCAAIVGETHAFLTRDDAAIRTTATNRLLLDLLKNFRIDTSPTKTTSTPGRSGSACANTGKTGHCPLPSIPRRRI